MPMFLLRDDVTIDQFIDSLDTSCCYIPMLILVNKIDLADDEYLQKLKSEIPDALFIAADQGYNDKSLREEIFRGTESYKDLSKTPGTQSRL